MADDSAKHSGHPVVIPEGGDITQGSQADIAWSGAGDATVVSLLKKIATSGGSGGGTSSPFGDPFPADGTAAGFKKTSDGSMQPGEVDNFGNLKVAVESSVLPPDAATETTLSSAKNDLDLILANQTNSSQKTQVTNFPATQPVSGTVNVGNFPATQDVHVTNTPSVSVSNFPATQPVTIADGADVAEGATSDVAVIGDFSGTVSAKLRGLSKIFNDVWDSVNHLLKVSISGFVTLPSATATGTLTNIGDTLVVSTSGAGAVTITQISTAGGWDGTVFYEASPDNGVTWKTITGYKDYGSSGPGKAEQGFSGGTNDYRRAPIQGFTNFRIRVTARTNGSAVFFLRAEGHSNPGGITAVQVNGTAGGNPTPLAMTTAGAANAQLQDTTGNNIGVDTGIPNTAQFGLDVRPINTIQTVTGLVGALNDVTTMALTGGYLSVGFMVPLTENLIGTITPQLSYDSGTTWVNTRFVAPDTGQLSATLSLSGAGNAGVGIDIVGAPTHVRVKVTAYTSGTATTKLTAALGPDTPALPIGQATLATSIPVALPTDGLTPIIVSGTFNAANAAVTSPFPSGYNSASYSVAASGFNGTILCELSYDNAVTWQRTRQYVSLNGTIVASQAFVGGGLNGQAILVAGAPTHVRARVSTYVSGSATATIQVGFGSVPSDATASTGVSTTNAASVLVAGNIPASSTSGFVSLATTTPGPTDLGVITREAQRGQSNMAGSIPFTLASDQPDIGVKVDVGLPDTVNSGTLGALNDAVPISLAGYCGASVTFSASLVGTVICEVSYDGGATWLGSYFVDITNLRYYPNITPTASSLSIFIPGGVSNVRVKVAAYTSGSITATMRATTTQSTSLPLPAFTGAASQGLLTKVVIGGYQFGLASSAILALGIDDTSAAMVGGNVADGQADQNYPVKIGARYDATQPTYTSGQRVNAHATQRGAIIVGTGVEPITASVNGLVTDTPESYNPNDSKPLSLTTDGRLRVSVEELDGLDFFAIPNMTNDGKTPYEFNQNIFTSL